MHKCALSEQGAKDMIKAFVSVTVSNLVLMVPIALLYYMVKDYMEGNLAGKGLWYVAGIVVTFILIAVTTYIQYNATFLATYIESGVRRITLAEKLRKIPLSFFGKKDLSDLTSTIMADCAQMETASSHFVPELVGACISTTIVAIGLFFFDWRMAMAALWVLPISFIIVACSGKVQRSLNKKQMDLKMACADGIQEGLESARDLRAYNSQEEYMGGLDKKIKAVEKHAIVTELGTKVNPEKDKIEFNGQVVSSNVKKVYIFSARLIGSKVETNAKIEVLLLKRKENNVWETLVKPGKKAKVGAKISFGDGLLMGEVIDVVEEGNRLIKFDFDGIFEEILDQLGQMPLPPYITHQLEDKNRYQTVYATHTGSAAAPTAGLHFTPELLEEIKAKGVDIAKVTLHVGLGTFRPVKVDEITEHHMHSEFFMIDEEAAEKINRAKESGHRVICVGTTSCRTVESAADENGHLEAKSGWTQIFIYPGYKFKVLDCLITNFHLPESTLIMLVSALAGREHVLAAYEEAVKEKYRFFSFGDAMFIQ